MNCPSLLGALVLAAGLVHPALAAPWPQRAFNPVPAEGDVELPLPCEGTIVFRSVSTGTVGDTADPDALLYDKEVQLGRTTNGSRSYMENRRTEYISGPIDNEGESFYLMGKYEVTVAQYKAVMTDDAADCPDGKTPAQAVPASGLSWYDAVEFTRRLNAWLYRESGDNIVAMQISAGIQDGYVRLPTETEWEFATRGGLVVSAAERADASFAMPEGLDAYAWSNSPQSANGKLRPIGTRKPNPIGLHDVYGNVSELVLEPFRMTRASRLHGRIGGYVTKGGSFLDDPGVMNSALRNEYPYFSQQAHGEVSDRRVGLRVVMGTVAIGRDADVVALEQAATDASRESPDVPQQESVGARMETLAERTEDAELKREIEALRAELAAEFERRNELELKSVRATLVNAALAAREVLIAERAIDKYYVAREGLEGDRLQRLDAQIAENRLVFDQFARRHADAILSLAGDHADAVPAQAQIAADELSREGSGDIVDYVRLVARQVAAYRTGAVTETRDILLGMLQGQHTWLTQ